MGIDRKRMLEVADGVERVASRVDAVLARRDAPNEHWVYSGKENKHVSKHPTLELAKREANKLESSTGYEHSVHKLQPLGNGSYVVKSRHFPDWNHVTSGNRSNWTSEKGRPEDRVHGVGAKPARQDEADGPAGAGNVKVDADRTHEDVAAHHMREKPVGSVIKVGGETNARPVRHFEKTKDGVKMISPGEYARRVDVKVDADESNIDPTIPKMDLNKKDLKKLSTSDLNAGYGWHHSRYQHTLDESHRALRNAAAKEIHSRGLRIER